MASSLAQRTVRMQIPMPPLPPEFTPVGEEDRCVECGQPRAWHYDSSGAVMLGCPVLPSKVLVEEHFTLTEEELRRIDGMTAVDVLVERFGAKSVFSWLNAVAAMRGEGF